MSGVSTSTATNAPGQVMTRLNCPVGAPLDLRSYHVPDRFGFVTFTGDFLKDTCEEGSMPRLMIGVLWYQGSVR